MDLTERQHREIQYHVKRAQLFGDTDESFSPPKLSERRYNKWWNHHCFAIRKAREHSLIGETALVPGCGEGFDAIALASLGASVSAFDISPDMLDVARRRAAKSDLKIEFRCAAAEATPYPDDTFDLVFIRDILHHCNVPAMMAEIVRVARPGATFIIDELYTHSWLQELRGSRLGQWMYPKVARHIYEYSDRYITEDERKLNESDLSVITGKLPGRADCEFFNAVVGRFVPDWDFAQRLDRLALKLLSPVGRIIAGRFIVIANS